ELWFVELVAVRHLDVVVVKGIECTASSVSYISTGRGDDFRGVLETIFDLLIIERGIAHTKMIEVLSCHLIDVEDGVGFQNEEPALAFVAVLVGLLLGDSGAVND